MATNVFDRDWDLLVVLDACRVDLIKEVASDYPYIRNVCTIYSVASQSEDWLNSTFEEKYRSELQDTILVTGNPYSETVLSADDFLVLDEVWRYAWDDSVGTIPARPITDRAVKIGRQRDFDRFIVHYMQPHFPCVPKPRLSSGVEIDDFGFKRMSVWKDLASGRLSRDKVWSAYLRNLRYVLDELSLFLTNFDAPSVAVTADHGNALGEGGEFGHERDSSLQVVREVPWIETTATDADGYTPDDYDIKPTQTSADEQLEALGYK